MQKKKTNAVSKKKPKDAVKKKKDLPVESKSNALSKKKVKTAKTGAKVTAVKKARPLVKAKSKPVTKKKEKVPVKKKAKPAAKKVTTVPVPEPVTETQVHGEDLHLIPQPGESLPLTDEIARKHENEFHKREEVAFRQEDMRIKDALAKRSIKGYRHRGNR